jgi:hypothetical protein
VPHMVLAANRRACGPVGGAPREAWADVTGAGGMFVQHVGPQQFIEVGRLERREPCSCCLHRLGTGLQRARLIWDGRSDCP